MGVPYKRNIKNQYGRPDIVGNDTLELGATALSGVTGDTTLADAQGLTTYALPIDAKLEGVVVSVGSALAAGAIGVDARLDGVSVATGVLGVGDASKYLLLSKAKQEDVTAASGAAYTLHYQVQTDLGAAVGLSTRTLFTLLR